MSETERLLANAGRYAATFAAPASSGNGTPKVAVVACMDHRVDVWRLFGLELGQVQVVRNAGGVVTDDVIRSLVVSQRLIGTEEIVLVHHTRCGMLGFRDEPFLAELEAETGARPSWAPGAMPDLEDDLREGMAAVRACPWLPYRDSVRAFVYDVDTGRVSEVLPGTGAGSR